MLSKRVLPRQAIALFLLWIVLGITPLYAQECGESAIKEAAEKYKYGQFEELLEQLNPCMESGFSESDKKQAYRLIAMSHLALGNDEVAQNTVLALIQLDPTFQVTSFDSPQFKDLVDETKAKMKQMSFMNIKVESASKSKQDLKEAPNPMTVVGNNYIENYGSRSMNDILYHTVGFYPCKDYERSTVGSRGLSEGWNNNHILLLVDGVPFNDTPNGTAYTWDITPLIFTRSFEVMRGPGSGLYGSSAANGTLTLNTISGDDFFDRFGYFQTQLGNKNTRITSLVTGFSADYYSMVLAYNKNVSDGEEYDSYDGSLEKDANGNLKKFKIHDDRKSTYFFAKIEGKQQFSGLSFQYHRQDWDYESGYGWAWSSPDYGNKMMESRDMAVLKYKKDISDVMGHEYVIRYQNHAMDWNMRFYREGQTTNGIYYPNGLTEYLKTNIQDVFARAQYSFSFPKNMLVLTGFESTVFYYGGDKEHYANANIASGGDYAPFPNGEYMDLDDYMEYITGHPVTNLAAYAQISTGEIFSNKIKFTLGVRHDVEFFNYKDIKTDKIESKNFSQPSFRLALVLLPTEKLTVKLMGGTAFRAPTPTEMFGANTLAVSSNLENLEPEKIVSLESGLDYQFNKHWNLRISLFKTDSKNQIAYSSSGNKSTNLYSMSNLGLESELLYVNQMLTGYVNGSFYKRLDEDIFVAEQQYISEHKTRLSWSPACVANLGVNYLFNSWNFSVSSHFQGTVKRRDKDLYDDATLKTLNLTSNPRTTTVGAWMSLDSKIRWQVKDVELSLSVTNILGTENTLIKSTLSPFDYRGEGRRILLGIKFNFPKWSDRN